MTFTWASRGSRWAAAAAVALALWASAAPTLIYPVYAAEWHLTTAVTTTVFAAYPVALIATLLLLGGVSETVGNRGAILAGLGFLGLGGLTFLLAPNLALLLVGRALMGVGVGLSLGPATSVIASAGADDTRDRTGAITAGASSVGLITALLVGGATVQFSTNPLHAGYGVLLAGVVVAVVAAWYLPRRLRTAAHGWRPRPLAVPRHRLPFVAGALGVSAAYALGAIFLGIGAQFARDTVRSDDAFVNGVVLAISAAAIGVVALLTGRLRAPTALRLGAVAALAAQSLMIVAGATHSMTALVLYSLIGGAGYSLLFSGGVTLVTRSAPAEHRAATTSSAYLVAYLVQAGTALAVGRLATANGLQIALVVGSATVIALALAAVLTVRARAVAPEPLPAPLDTAPTSTTSNILMKASS
ncbi:MFS transporter [Promicromonospora sp. MEB111]|uniref:MFS transporter n=1 Tax=unclassified Promicromonospora TaxID=2647929 RepID=UPI00254EB9D8|nr:MFS transporter [Promicromonospora sp. MEB111]